MFKVKDLTGQRFGRLTVIEQHGFTKMKNIENEVETVLEWNLIQKGEES